jgi:hypothetical protein
VDESVASRLKSPGVVRELLASLEGDAGQTYDLLFHASFADKLLPVMQKAGPGSDGYSRMQQTYAEAVEKVRDMVARAGVLGFRDAARYTVLTPMAMSSLVELIHDLAHVKQSFRE